VTRAGAVALLATLQCACSCASANASGALTAAVVRAGSRCGGDEEGTRARWIASEGAYRDALASGGLVAEGDASPAPVDFTREVLVLVAMGVRPTGGYALALADPEVKLADGVATIVVRFEGPPPGAMVTQALTSPCLLIRLPREGVRAVRVVDPSGALRATASPP
jgi:hypothetical protein